MKLIIIVIILIIIIIYTIVDSYLYLNYNTTINNIIFNYNTKTANDDILPPIIITNDNFNKIDTKNEANKELLIKYSSIKNKLDTTDDYIGFYAYIDNIKNSIYISIIDNIIYDETQIIEIITNDIQKTKLKYNFNKLKNIFVIYKLKDRFNKIIIFYDGLIYNEQKFKFIENDFSGNTVVYKLNLRHKLINHYLQ
jgi:hypothetical protein